MAILAVTVRPAVLAAVAVSAAMAAMAVRVPRQFAAVICRYQTLGQSRAVLVAQVVRVRLERRLN